MVVGAEGRTPATPGHAPTPHVPCSMFIRVWRRLHSVHWWQRLHAHQRLPVRELRRCTRRVHG